MRLRLFPLLVLTVLAWATAALADDVPLPTTDEIKKLVDAGQYQEALKPLYRVLALKGPAATGYDRWELLMLRAECQMQLKDQHAALGTLDDARKEAVLERKYERTIEPVGLALLIQRSNAYKYKSTSNPALNPIPILDPILRRAAYAELLTDELPAARKKVESLNNAKTITPVLEAAKAAGAMHALEILSSNDPKADTPLTTPLTGKVTANVDRLFSTSLEDLNSQADVIARNANQIIRDYVTMTDAASKKSWVEPRTRRRGPTDQEAQALTAGLGTCDKIHAAAAEFAVTLVTDFDTYRSLAAKADELKAKITFILKDDYLVVPQ